MLLQGSAIGVGSWGTTDFTNVGRGQKTEDGSPNGSDYKKRKLEL
jgi:hypothetical protein